MLDDLVPLAGVEIEAGGEGVGGILVEVPLGHLVVDVTYQLQTLLKVGPYLLVGLGDVAAVVVVVNRGDGLVEVGHADVVAAELVVLVGLREAVDQDEVVVGTDEQALGACGIVLAVGHEARLGGDAVERQHTLVDRVDGRIESCPEGCGRVARSRRLDGLEAEHLVVLTAR